MLSLFQMYSVQCWGEESKTFCKGSHDNVKLSCYLSGWNGGTTQESHYRRCPGRELNRTHPEYKSEVLKLGKENHSDTGRESNQTHPEYVWSVRAWKKIHSDPGRESNRTHPEYNSEVFKLEKKNNNWLRLLNFRLVFRLNNLHFLRPSHTCSSNLSFAWKFYTHRTPNAGLRL